MMTNDPAGDWEAHEARRRAQNRRYARERSCADCQNYHTPPEGRWGWCEWLEEYALGDQGMTECEFWID